MKTNVVARMTVIRSVGVRTIIEVHADATFSAFYRYYTQDGRKYSTKRLVRTANRNFGLESWRAVNQTKPGLEMLAFRFIAMPHVISVKIRIIRKREYRRLLTATPDGLGLVKVRSFTDPRLQPRPVLRYPVRIPSTHTTLERRMKILTGG